MRKIGFIGQGKIWAEMSTTDEAEVCRLGARVKAVGAEPEEAGYEVQVAGRVA